MRRRLFVECALWTGVAVLAVHTALAVAGSTARPTATLTAIPPAPAIADDPASGDSLASAAEYVTANDPFRANHRPSTVAFGAPAPQPGYPTPSVVRPVLTLRGIVGTAPRWSALLAGIPAHEGTVVVHAGDTIAGLRIARITGSDMVIRGADTTWHLVLEAPWR